MEIRPGLPVVDQPLSPLSPMRQLIAGNWKMNGLSAQLDVIERIRASVAAAPPCADVLICPPATLIGRAMQAAAGCIAIGGQDCASEIAGAFTGDTSAEMLRDAGASAVIVGHSERRRQHGETDAVVAAKVRAARRAGLMAIVCIGETLAQRQDGNALSVCGEQLLGSLPEDALTAALAIAYEPLWAIGSGHTPAHEQIEEMHGHIRAVLTTRFGATASEVRILYGGSVNPSNASAILATFNVGGALVGGPSLRADTFEAILACAEAGQRGLTAGAASLKSRSPEPASPA